MADEYDYLFKCIVVGDGGVGKTALTIRFSKGFFTEDYKMTIGVDFHVKTISIDTEEEGPIKVKLQIWDTGGQERFSSIRPMYYRGSLGGLLIFDLTSYESFEHLPQWIEEVRANIKSEIPLLLVGNKSDLINERALSNEEINNFMQKFNLYYMETSAKTGEGVGDCFYILACLMVGSGIPDQLISQEIVYSPGQIIPTPSITPTEPTSGIEPEVDVITAILEPKPETQFTTTPLPEATNTLEPEPEIDFAAPPVPEPAKIFEPEPEIDFAAPPVPEPTKILESEPEIDFTISPIPEDTEIFKPEPKIDFITPPIPEDTEISEPEPEIDFAAPPVPEPAPVKESGSSSAAEPPVKDTMEFEFKTPEQILSGEVQEEELKSPFTMKSEISVSSEPPAYKPKAIPFTSNIPVPAPAPEEFKKSEPVSELLVDYMPETIISKKERKKLEKQKKKKKSKRNLKKKERKQQNLKKKCKKSGRRKNKKQKKRNKNLNWKKKRNSKRKERKQQN